jgi:hypothetical protein
MILLAVLFVFAAVSMYVKRFKPVLASVLVCLAFFSVLALSCPDTLIAEYNVDRYLDGTLEAVDIEAMYELGDAAVPAMVRLYENILGTATHELKLDLYDYLEEKFYECKETTGFFSYNLPAGRARNALSRIYNLK